MPKMQNAERRFDGFILYPGIPEFPDFSKIPLAARARHARKTGRAGVFVFSGQASRQIGVGVTSLTKQLGEVFRRRGRQGLLINNFREKFTAAKAGLKAGDVITEVEGKEIKGI